MNGSRAERRRQARSKNRGIATFASASGYAATIRTAILKTREDHADVIAGMPDKATTVGQRALQKEHGTPKEFAAAVVNAIGEISVLEANVAIRKYRDEWEAA